MRTYVLVSFWFGVFAVVCGLLLMAAGKFPIKSEKGLGEVVAKVLVSAGWAAWAGFLLWGQKWWTE